MKGQIGGGVASQLETALQFWAESIVGRSPRATLRIHVGLRPCKAAAASQVQVTRLTEHQGPFSSRQ